METSVAATVSQIGHSVSVTAGASPEFDRVKSVLEQRGVNGWADFGYFVNRPDLFRPSDLDERAAMPVLLDLLQTLTDADAVAATARHLRRPWAKPIAFVPLVEAFTKWAASSHTDAGWALGDAVASAARSDDTETLISLVTDPAYGTARQMIVHSLWRFRKDSRVANVLQHLAEDPDVSLHAMGALRRTVGNDAALALLHRLSQTSPDRRVREQATKEMKKAERAARR